MIDLLEANGSTLFSVIHWSIFGNLKYNKTNLAFETWMRFEAAFKWLYFEEKESYKTLKFK